MALGRRTDKEAKRGSHLRFVCPQSPRLKKLISEVNSDLSVHHIVPLKVDYDRRLDNDNLITLCRYHHEAAERGYISRLELANITCAVDFSHHNI